MNAVAVSDINAATFADVLKNGAKVVENTGCAIVPEFYLDVYSDWAIEQEAARRLKNSSGKMHSWEDVMREIGITQTDLDAMPEVEIE